MSLFATSIVVQLNFILLERSWSGQYVQFVHDVKLIMSHPVLPLLRKKVREPLEEVGFKDNCCLGQQQLLSSS